VSVGFEYCRSWQAVEEQTVAAPYERRVIVLAENFDGRRSPRQPEATFSTTSSLAIVEQCYRQTDLTSRGLD
jgi:hypothetical protein